MAAVPFGFSFGDFIAAIELINKAAQALKRSSGAQSHFHQTVADLESFEIVLRRVEALSPMDSSLDTIEAIRLCAFKCHLPLNHFIQQVRVYEPHMGRVYESNTQLVDGLTGSFWKVKWAVKIEKEVAKLKADIGPLLEAMNVLLQIESREQTTATHDGIKRLENNITSGLDRILLAVRDQALATRQINLQVFDIHHDKRIAAQQIPQLATPRQVDGPLCTAESVSTRAGFTATEDQIDQLTSLLQASLITQQ